jgi:hypothetical protein
MQPLVYQLPHVPVLGKGLVMFDRFDANGLPTGLYPFGNCTKLEVEPKDDIAELYESINSASNLIATALKKRQVKISITGTDFKSDVLALVLMSASGKSVNVTAAGTITAEVLVSATATHANRYHQFANMNVDNVVTPPVLTNNAVVLVAGVDYVVADPTQGLVWFPATTSALDGHATTATYKTLVGSNDQIAAYVAPQLTGRLKFSPDPTDGAKTGLDAWRVNLSPSGNLGVIADDYGNWTLEGLVLDDSVLHPLSPYILLTEL